MSDSMLQTISKPSYSPVADESSYHRLPPPSMLRLNSKSFAAEVDRGG